MRRVLAGLLMLGLVQQAFGWGHEGHRMVVPVAADHLTPVAAESVRRTEIVQPNTASPVSVPVPMPREP